MSPLFFSFKNSNNNNPIVANEEEISLIVDDTTTITNSSSIPVLIESTASDKCNSSKVIEILGKNLSYLIATSGNITGQMIISTTVAKTPWSKENVLNSLLFSGWLIALDTLSEPHIFSSVAKIKNWMIDKWKKNENDTNLKKELLKVTTILFALSYSGVLLDRASNHLLDNLISVEIAEQTGVEFVSYILNSTFHSAIISIFEKGIKLSWNKFKSLFSDNKTDIESQSYFHEQENTSVETEASSSFFCKSLLQLSAITPISMFVTWATENLISKQEFSVNKILTDSPKVIGGIVLSLSSSLLNCMVNKEEIPFLPQMSTIKKWCCIKTDINNEQVIENNEHTNSVSSSSTTDFEPVSNNDLIRSLHFLVNTSNDDLISISSNEENHMSIQECSNSNEASPFINANENQEKNYQTFFQNC